MTPGQFITGQSDRERREEKVAEPERDRVAT